MKEEKKVEKAEKKTEILSAKVEKIAQEIEGLTALELSELAKHLEDVFGVSAMPMTGAAMPTAGGASAGGSEEPAEEKSSFTVVLADSGANKLAVIKAVREIKPDLGLMDAKKLVESTPKELLAGVKKEEAEQAKKKIEDAGGKIELK